MKDYLPNGDLKRTTFLEKMRSNTKRLLFFMAMVTIVLNAEAQNKPVIIKKVTAKELKAFIDTSNGPTIVNFWATWCGPCIREIPWFDSIITAKKAPVKLVLASIDFGYMYPHELTNFVVKQGYKGEVVYLAETNAEVYIPVIDPKWSGAIPTSIFVDRSKNYYQLFNHQLTKERFSIELDKLIGKE